MSGAKSKSAAVRHDLLHVLFEFSTGPVSATSRQGRRRTAFAGMATRRGPVPEVRVDSRRAGRHRPSNVANAVCKVESVGAHAHAAHVASRFAFNRAARAAVRPATSFSGTPAPFPKCISSGVWPRNAACGTFELCSST